MQIDVVAKPAESAAVSVVFVGTNKKLAGPAVQFLAGANAAATQALMAPGFAGKRGQVLDLLSPAGHGGRRILIVGLGELRELTAIRAPEIGGEIAHCLMSAKEEAAQIIAPAQSGKLDEAAFLANVALGARLRAYHFRKYITQAKKDDQPGSIAALHLVSAKRVATEKALAEAQALGEGICYARDLVNEPPSTLYPESFAKKLLELKKFGIQVEIQDEKALAKMGAGGILAVAQGSVNPPRLVSLRWNGLSGKSGGTKSKAPIALVGKGVCFDSGGLCLKRPNQMFPMKGDMGGAAAVTGAVLAAALRKAKVDVVAVMALVENMPSGSSYKPGDIVKTLSGKTIEIFDTDAEGRITLVDSLYYAASKFNPVCILDAATLTYSVMAALGPVFTGLFATQDALAREVTAAGEAAGEPVWRLPVHEGYLENLKSKIADYRHHATDEMAADAPHAAALMGEFVAGKPWAHLDIADKEMAHKDKPYCPEGASGHGVALFDAFLRGRE
ncbi:MAG TPA: leucyl aminopeptidase [Alphaproteobacteria bacterium]|nr:leucyl aminopeptidase [Alphaproteobacteria bacterium]